MIRSAILSHYAQVATSMKLNTARMLKRARLATVCLVNPNVPIPAVRAIELIECSAIEAGSSTFGIRLALARGTPDLGPLNLLLREEPDLRSALRSLQSHLHVHSRSIRFVLDEGDDTATWATRFALATPYPPTAPQSTEMIVCGMLRSIKWLSGENWSPVLLCLSHAAPGETRTHRTLLGCRVAFDQPFDGLVIRRSDLDRPIAHASPLLRRYAEAYVQSLASASSSDFQGIVTELIHVLLPAGRCSAAALARHLDMDRSTLSRRLAQVDQTYSSLLQTARVALASRSCLAGWPLADVADQLGFAELSIFSRWFRRSFGCSARAWRQVHSPRVSPARRAA